MTDLDPKLTFENFVVGPANRLASAAARRSAESPGTSYNPLFVYSASGLGKSHILTAIAHQARRSNGKLRVFYQALESYLEELADALERGNRDDLRDRYRDLDLLLLDDVQFLAGQPEAQEMLLSTLDALSGSGSQIVLASDRPPAEINGLDARLLSRFSGGLIVDIGPPEYETRVAIIRRKVEERGQTLEPGVAEAVARYPLRNVRELGGALNRILAIQDLEERQVGIREVPEIMGDEVAGDDDDFDSFLDEISEELATTVEVQEEPWRKALRETAEDAVHEGFVTNRLQAFLEEKTAPDEWEARLERFTADLARLREIDEELDRLGNPWPEAAQGVVKDPDRLEDAEALLASVQERTRPFPELGPGPSLGDLEGAVPPLALKAVDQLVTAEKPQYNPLFVWSEEPAGPRALLAAAGRVFRGEEPEARIAVISVSEFSEDFIRALSSGVAGAWRERWWTVDLLLVHGAEALSDTERAQDEFFHLFEALKRRGSRVLIAADRPPSGIGGIDERLRSRFEGGLVLEVQGAEVSSGADDLSLREPSEAPPDQEDESVGEESQSGEGPVIPPLNELDMGEGRGGLFVSSDAPRNEAAASAASAPEGPSIMEPGPPGGEDAGGRWVPSREKVMWYWPDLRDRLVEDLE